MISAQIAQILWNFEVKLALRDGPRLSHLTAVVIWDLFLFLDNVVYLRPVFYGLKSWGAEWVVWFHRVSWLLCTVDGLIGHLKLAFWVAPRIWLRVTLRHELQVMPSQNAARVTRRKVSVPVVISALVQLWVIVDATALADLDSKYGQIGESNWNENDAEHSMHHTVLHLHLHYGHGTSRFLGRFVFVQRSKVFFELILCREQGKVRLWAVTWVFVTHFVKTAV